MQVAPSFLDRRCASLAQGLMALLRAGGLPSRQDRLVRAILAYYIAPWDIIPDIVPGLGTLDDWLALLVIAKALGAPPGDPPGEVDVEAVTEQIKQVLRGPPIGEASP